MLARRGKYLFLIKPMGSADYLMQYFSSCTYSDVLKFIKAHDVQKSVKRKLYMTNIKNTERQELRK